VYIGSHLAHSLDPRRGEEGAAAAYAWAIRSLTMFAWLPVTRLPMQQHNDCVVVAGGSGI